MVASLGAPVRGSPNGWIVERPILAANRHPKANSTFPRLVTISSFALNRSAGQRRINHGEMVFLGYEIRVRDSQYVAEFFCGNLEGSGRRRRPGRGLRKCSGHGRVEGDIALHFLHYL